MFSFLDKTFVIIMKFNGVPSSLNVITNKTSNGGPLLAPYPDWTWAENENCTGIMSVYKIEVIIIETFSIVTKSKLMFLFQSKKMFNLRTIFRSIYVTDCGSWTQVSSIIFNPYALRNSLPSI